MCCFPGFDVSCYCAVLQTALLSADQIEHARQSHPTHPLNSSLPAAFFIWFVIGIATMAFLVLTVVFHKRIFSPIPVRASCPGTPRGAVQE